MMSTITANLLKLIIADQQETHILPSDYIERSAETLLAQFSDNPEVIVLTGLRRSGKSVLLHRIRQQSKRSDYYFNFEDERLATFTVDNFQLLLEVFIELFGLQKTFYFDEIQNIEGWELFVRRLYNSGNKLYITGSNANLFSEELGTRLTGRYISVYIYPLSFLEYLKHYRSKTINISLLSTTQIGEVKQLFSKYCTLGGIPEYIKHHQIDYLHALYESILYRDIIVRYKISSDDLIKKLAFYLASNCSKEVTYSSLRKLLGTKSATTISDYCRYFGNSYLIFFVNRYSDSVKAQLQSPKKVYFIDHVIAKTIGFRFSEDVGRMFENIVFLELKRRNLEIFYYKGSKECDFIVRKSTETILAIQVSKELSDPKTKQREVEGLLEALLNFSLDEGLIITENEDAVEYFQKEEKNLKITFIPLWKWLLSE